MAQPPFFGGCFSQHRCFTASRRTIPHLPGVWLTLLPFFWLTLSSHVVGSEVAGDQPDIKAIDEVGKSALADANVKSALDVLRTEVGKTRSALPAGLSDDFVRAIPLRLDRIQRGVSNKIGRAHV